MVQARCNVIWVELVSDSSYSLVSSSDYGIRRIAKEGLLEE